MSLSANWSAVALTLSLGCLGAAPARAEVANVLQQRAQINAFLRECWLKGQVSGPVAALQRCYTPEARLRESREGQGVTEHSAAALAAVLDARSAALAPTPAAGPPSVDFDLLQVIDEPHPQVRLLLHRRLRGGADEAEVRLGLHRAADGSLRIHSELTTPQATLPAAELPPRLRGADWLLRAKLGGAHPLLLAFLQRPENPLWDQALVRYLEGGALTCDKRDERDGCVSSTWGYARLDDTATATDGCLRRQVVRAALQKLDQQALGKALPALVEVLKGGAFDSDADLALALLGHVPAGGFALTGPLLRALADQALAEVDNHMPLLDEHLAALPEEALRSLVSRKRTYGGVARALAAPPSLSAPSCLALALAARTVPVHDRETRIAALWALGPCPAQVVAADLRLLGAQEGDRYVRFTAAQVLAGHGDKSLLPGQRPPQSDRDVLDLAALAAVEPDGPERTAHLQALLLPGATMSHTIVEENDNFEQVTRHREEPLTLAGLRKALELRAQVRPVRHPTGYEGLSRSDGFMGAPERYDLKPGRSKDGRRGVLRVYHHEDHSGGSC